MIHSPNCVADITARPHRGREIFCNTYQIMAGIDMPHSLGVRVRQPLVIGLGLVPDLPRLKR